MWRLSLNFKTQKKIFNYANKKRIMIFSTPFDFESADSFSNLSSGTSTIPILGSIVQNGKLAASAFLEAVRALKSVDFPTFGKPTIPHLNPI